MIRERVDEVLAFWAMLVIAGPIYFFIFWTWFAYWRRHRLRTYALVLGIFAGAAALIAGLRRWTYAEPLRLPMWLEAVGWGLMAIVGVFGFVADRQIGFHVRIFTPFFEPRGRIELRTKGAYGVVRHPIYAAGIGWLLATFLVTGYTAVLVAWAIFTLSAIWFSKREEEHLVALLADPAEYERYRARVPALFPVRPRRPEPA